MQDKKSDLEYRLFGADLPLGTKAEFCQRVINALHNRPREESSDIIDVPSPTQPLEPHLDAEAILAKTTRTQVLDTAFSLGITPFDAFLARKLTDAEITNLSNIAQSRGSWTTPRLEEPATQEDIPGLKKTAEAIGAYNTLLYDALAEVCAPPRPSMNQEQRQSLINKYQDQLSRLEGNDDTPRIR